MSAALVLWMLVALPQAGGGGEAPAPGEVPPAQEPPAVQEAPPAPAAQEPPPSERWWRDLPPEERERLVERWRRFRELPPAVRAEIERRRAFVEAERERLLAELSPEERARLEALPPGERRRVVERLLRQRLEARTRDLGREHPDWGERFRDRPVPERFRDSTRLLEEHRRPQLLAALDREVEEGWLGPKTREWARQAPVPELAEVLGQVRKWRALERLGKEGMAERWRLDPLQWQALVELPPRVFFRALGALRRGVPPERALRPGGMGPGPGFGPGIGPEGPPGARPGPRGRWRPGEGRVRPGGPGLRRPPRRPRNGEGPLPPPAGGGQEPKPRAEGGGGIY